MIVVDTSALIGAWHMHYLPDSIAGFWTFLDQAVQAGRAVIPLAVLEELAEQSEGTHGWVRERRAFVVAPSRGVQQEVGELMDRFRFKEGRDRADPFVIAEAKLRGMAVTTYEGRSPTGSVARAKANVDNIPTICQALSVECLTPGEAWRLVGLSI